MVDYLKDWKDSPADDPQVQHDFGAVFLPSTTLHQRVGHTLNFTAFSDADVHGVRIANVIGFPNRGDRFPIMETDDGPLLINQAHPLDPHILKHLLETHEGQSGGPIIHYNTATTAMNVFGIHTYFSDDANLARRIDQGLADTIRRWIADPRPFLAGMLVG
jgi:V8-like Glu-specific endopeptidase